MKRAAQQGGTTLPSRTERSRSDRTKSGGIHYTPPELAAFVAECALDEVEASTRLRVLDPACGDGALLAAIATAATSGCQIALTGYDLDEGALTVAEDRLKELGRPYLTWTVEERDFLAELGSELKAGRSLFGPDDLPALRGSFDIIVANPPYVRTQILGSTEAKRLAGVFRLSGRVDLYHAFVVAMSEALAPNGVLALLCSNRFMTTRTGVALRRYMQNHLDLRTVYDLGDTKLFSAAVLPAIVVAKRRPPMSKSARMIAVYESIGERDGLLEAPSVLNPLRDGVSGLVRVQDKRYDIRRGSLPLCDGSSQPWVPVPDVGDWVAQVDRVTKLRFGDVGKTRVGIKTTADSVFIRTDWHELGPDKPEEELLLPLLTHHVARRWAASTPIHQVLYPYRLDQARRSPVDIEQWPLTKRYLAQHRPRLESRTYVVAGGRQWWEIWVPQRPSQWAAPKLVFPDISDHPRFLLDRSGAIVNGDCYWLSLPSEEQERLGLLMMAIANSTLGTRYYDRVCANKLYSGRRRYITQYVERFPIPDPDRPESKKVIRLTSGLLTGNLADHDKQQLEAELDSLVWRSFGFEEVPG